MGTLVVENIRALYTMVGDDLGLVDDATVVCEGDAIAYAGPRKGAPPVPDDAERLDARGKAVLPGLIDCHTHLIWAGSRRDEFALRARGASYAEIMAAGGGIRSTMRAVRTADEDTLAKLALPRLEALLWRGVTTVEAKSGYGLTTEDELKCLRALRRLHEIHEVDIVPTFLGAHAVPPEYEGRREDYVSVVVDEMLPAVQEDHLADFCDVFVESGAFTVDDGRRILTRAQELGLGVRVHAEQLSSSGGARLAAELGAVAAGHLEFANDDDIRLLAEAGVVCEVLSLAQVFLGMERRIPGRKLKDAGCTVAVATDLNPGSANSADLHLAAGLSMTMCGLTAEEALLGITRNAASALRRDDIGVLAPGKRADLVVLDSDSAYDLVYEWGQNHVARVVKNGRVLDLGE